ncbi:LemA family protein [Salinactinospora qingdaonensis]|uniref:Membrane protein n=1 Tax=Salinactinospora qingdaonensis TaxID=702744 RepID=A0ABP7FXI7_9ACTN
MGLDWVPLIVTAVALAVLFSFYLSWRVGRLDRLHTRVETARAALDAALLRRSSVVLELASLPELEPASRVLLADAAGRARRADDPDERELAESNLSRALRAVISEPELGEALGDVAADDGLLAEVEAAAKRVLIARRFYNDAVAAIRDVRSRRLVRTLRLAGHAPLPVFFDMDDEPPVFPGRS